ncbi:MAG: hypothetical protein CVV64_07310 [Candidatus Wallbacteria bacterium HGW-Wallbacteria-1]|jgi:serine phosphatase RsbU (regulator of sigma subunit)|uniref:PPM-type phosphatase domain-containing protein n=1 Tax=Candidatus Wallbacteria bacterium HGW-Wallbacteria-1 TaxID=2013854 RepID=A0A2N1PQQ8_9BACT|nr:MAG: hypothetical protein CVV64_07310 [Candidatus Wallbacteria bacterium HGW-Wallbacteria-1]
METGSLQESSLFAENRYVNIYRRRYFFASLLAGLIITLIYTPSYDLLEVMELKFLDRRFLWNRYHRNPAEVTVVQVDDHSLMAVNEKSWGRDRFATLVRLLREAGARVIAFDGLFTFETGEGRDQDELFEKALKESGNVVLGYYRSNDRTQRIIRPIPIFEKACAGIGLLEHFSDIDGLSRRMKIAELAGGKVRPSLALLAVGIYLNCNLDKDFQWDGKKLRIAGSRNGQKRNLDLDVDYNGLVYMNFSPKGPIQGTRPLDIEAGCFDVISASDILFSNPEQWRSRIQDRIVLFGYTSPTFHDIFPTVDGNIPGVYLHATFITNLLDGNVVRTLAPGLSWLILAMAGMFISLAFFALRPAWSVAALFSGIGGIWLFGYLGFYWFNLWIPMVRPLFVMVTSFVLVIAARYLVIAFENARMYISVLEKEKLEKDLKTAYKIQKDMLPKKCPRIPGLNIGAFSFPAKQVGGDYYDFFSVDLEKSIFHTVVADVSGKGIPAALIVAMTKTIMHALMAPDLNPAVYLEKINTFLEKEMAKTMYVTAMLLSIDLKQRRGSFVSAGHEAPLHYRASTGKCEVIPTKGFFLGMFQGVTYDSVSVAFEKGDRIILFTDGVLDAVNTLGERFCIENLMDLIQDNPELTAPELADRISSTIMDYSDENNLFDDFTAVVIEFTE